MNEKEKMLKGLLYDANNDKSLIAERIKCKNLCHKHNHLQPDNIAENLGGIMEKFKQYFDLKFSKTNAIVIALFVLCLVLAKVFNVQSIPENTLLENTQLVVLVCSFILCLKFKDNKVLFNFAAMAIFLMFMRELSYGRCIFCQLPDDPHQFYHWSHYKYGWLAHVIIGIYIAAAFLYAIINKIWLAVKDVFSNVKFPLNDVILMGILVVLQVLGEHNLHSSVLEEIAELTLYCAIFGLIYYYYKKLKVE